MAAAALSKPSNLEAAQCMVDLDLIIYGVIVNRACLVPEQLCNSKNGDNVDYELKDTTAHKQVTIPREWALFTKYIYTQKIIPCLCLYLSDTCTDRISAQC